ncbi:MAG TPA: tryptophan synthase subunit alpha [Candidatus Micrarchaeia archaeon]|nr:tryptophan synthase subunit alpha [Candidatus Micrarchaeia archaeon]
MRAAGAAAWAAALPAGGEVALVPYVMAGFPSPAATAGCLLATQEGGAAAVELGLPFSDPLADGPTIQRAGQVALEQGMTVARALGMVGEARRAGLVIPVATMTYLNPILQYGPERYCGAAAAAGVDGLLVPDLPVDEAGPVAAAAAAAGLGYVTMVAPTSTPERIAAAAALATGFVYCVARVGVTGARASVPPEALDLLQRVGAVTRLPRVLGFGLSRREHVSGLRGLAEGAVVASALLDRIGTAPDPVSATRAAVAELAGR